MRNRGQRRQRAILPLKIVQSGTTYLGHTLDISASGARVIMTTELPTETAVTVEYKHRRVAAKIAWCRPMKGRKYEFEFGLKLQNAGSDFWGVKLSQSDPDLDPAEVAKMPFAKVMTLLTLKRTSSMTE